MYQFGNFRNIGLFMGKAGVYYMIGDQLITVEVGMEAGKAYMRNTDTFACATQTERRK